MKYLALLLLATPALADNTIHKTCMKKHNYQGLNNSNFGAIAACIEKAKNEIIIKEEDRLWAFLQDNPHYRYPGVALPNGVQNPHAIADWGKPKFWSNSK